MPDARKEGMTDVMCGLCGKSERDGVHNQGYFGDDACKWSRLTIYRHALAERTAECERMRHDLDVAAKIETALRASLATAQKDGERLDWLENEMGLDYKVHLRKGRLAAYIDVHGREYDAAYEGDDLRSAIDAASPPPETTQGENDASR